MTALTLYTTTACPQHPAIAGGLRCNRCGQVICRHCAVLTPVGYRCQGCLRQQQRNFNTARMSDLAVAAFIAGLVGLAGAVAATFVGYLTIIAAPFVGSVTAEVVRWATRRRRGVQLPAFAVWSLVSGTAPIIGFYLLAATFGSPTLLDAAFTMTEAVWPVVYGGLAASALYARLRGISL